MNRIMNEAYTIGTIHITYLSTSSILPFIQKIMHIGNIYLCCMYMMFIGKSTCFYLPTSLVLIFFVFLSLFECYDRKKNRNQT